MKKIVSILLIFAISAIVLVGCSSSDYYDDSYSNSYTDTEDVIREQLGDGPADAYSEGERRWNTMTGQN